MSDRPPNVDITYCTRCRWLLRAAWLAQELLSTFEAELGGVTLKPGPSGEFQITVADELIWCRKRDGGFPQPKEIKQRIRDVIAPGLDLGHNEA